MSGAASTHGFSSRDHGQPAGQGAHSSHPARLRIMLDEAKVTSFSRVITALLTHSRKTEQVVLYLASEDHDATAPPPCRDLAPIDAAPDCCFCGTENLGQLGDAIDLLLIVPHVLW